MEVGQKFLITTDSYFVAPDGVQYRSVYGTIHAIDDAVKTLGIETNKGSTNWYVHIGNMVIAGCQIHYAIQTNYANTSPVQDASWGASGCTEYERPTVIYDADNLV